MRKRRAFTLVETVLCCVILAIVTIGTASVSAHVSALKVEARNSVFLTTHNLNVMERIRQMSYDLRDGEVLLAYYGPDTFSTSEISTTAYIDQTSLDDFYVYNIRLESKMQGYQQILVSTYTMTNIGGPRKPESIEDGGDPGVTLP